MVASCSVLKIPWGLIGRDRFPCCIVWTPLPFVTWLVPFIGHAGICREDGVILDFAGPNFVCVDNFAFGAVSRYIQINKAKVTFLQVVCLSFCFHLLQANTTGDWVWLGIISFFRLMFVQWGRRHSWERANMGWCTEKRHTRVPTLFL